MFEEYYQLSKTPFSRDIPTESLYQYHMLEEILGRLEYAAKRQLFPTSQQLGNRLGGQRLRVDPREHPAPKHS